MRSLIFVALAGVFFFALLAVAVRYALRARRSSAASWNDLLAQLQRIDRQNIAVIALDALPEAGEAYSLEPEAIWSMLGGMDGLDMLQKNCQVLIELAMYVQRWHPEALVVAEQLRLNAREIEWHIGRLRGAAQTGNLQSAYASYAQRAVATYYLMTRSVLQLYEQVSFPELTALQQAI